MKPNPILVKFDRQGSLVCLLYVGLGIIKQIISRYFSLGKGRASCNWPRGVTVSTLDSESSDRGSDPREASCLRQIVANLRSPSSRQIRLEGRQVRLACRPKTLACRLLHEPQGNKTPCGLVDKALVFETKDCRLESCQGHALGRACIATPDHAGLLESARRRFCHAVKHCKACSPCE